MVHKNMSSFVQEIGVQYHNIVVLKLSKKKKKKKKKKKGVWL